MRLYWLTKQNNFSININNAPFTSTKLVKLYYEYKKMKNNNGKIEDRLYTQNSNKLYYVT